MELTLWTYEGPPHVGAMRIATSMEGVHYVLHAPQGDTYADLLFTMIERRGKRPPVTYTTFQARDLGGDTAELVKTTVREAVERFQPRALLVGESCTAELIQDQPGSLASSMGMDLPVVNLELPAYSKKENWGAAETFYQLVRGLLKHSVPAPGTVRAQRPAGARPKVNLLGPSALGFRCRDDVTEVCRMLGEIGVQVAVVAPLGATVDDIGRIPDADLNICLYPEVAKPVCDWLERQFAIPCVRTVPIGIGATRDFLQEVGTALNIDVEAALRPDVVGASDLWSPQLHGGSTERARSRLPWYSRSVDSTYLTGKRVFVFGDGTHALAAARIARDELGFELVGLGTYSRECAKAVRKAAKGYGLEALVTDDYLTVEQAIADAAPELVLGTQMERHIAKRLRIPCAVISTPIHVQDVPARYAPQMGWEGANVIFDTWVHPLMMGLEEHLIGMFREDFEFVDGHQSHLHGGTEPQAATGATPAVAPAAERQAEHQAAPAAAAVAVEAPPVAKAGNDVEGWSRDGLAELGKVPFFVRGKVRRNTEAFAHAQGVTLITAETLYEAKAHYGR